MRDFCSDNRANRELRERKQGMSADERLDDLLDDWEELAERNPQADLDAFLRKRASDLDEESRAQFRQRAAALARMNQRLDALQETNSRPGNTSEPGNATSLLADLKPGYEPLEGYKIVERLGRGGFGEVWKATDAEGFSVAIKFVPLSSTFGDKELRSLEVIKDVRHPHLLSIVRVARRGDVLVIAMELAERSLADRFEEARKEGYDGIPREELLEYMAEAAKGIDFLNDPGSSGRPRIQHRDIKPANLLLSGSSVKIADYSLAQALKFHVTESVGSTPTYAAPEFFEGNTTSRSDQYCLGITYCQLRGGRVPFVGNLTELMDAHRNREPDLSMLPPEERPVVGRALSKKSKDRWPTCTDFVRQLRDLDNDKKLSAEPSRSENPAPKTTKRSTRSWLLATAGFLSLLLLVCWMSGLFSNPGQTPQRSNVEQEQSTKTIETQATTDRHLKDDNRRRIAVLYFENQSEDGKELDALAKGLCSMMITRLETKHQYDLVERERLQDVLDELKLTRSGMFDQKAVANIGKLVGARLLVLGSYFQILNVFRIDARLVDVETGITITAAGVEGKPDEFSALLSRLVDQLVENHHGIDHAEPPKGNPEQAKDLDAISLQLALALGTAVDAFDRGDRAKAVTTVKMILESDPSFEDAKRLLSDWTTSPSKPEDESPNEK